VSSYLGGGASAGGAGLLLSQRLLADAELSFASGQPAGGTTGVDYWSEDVAL
jgi:hypothetical protein